MTSPPTTGSPAFPPNRLAREASPYLLQHAHNPVDWYPWGPEAFAAARARNVPIFLSVGYSTCYWCHVMERESFEDPATGTVLNAGFVCVKVDREQRPDVDDIYMAAVQLMTRRGGWPMSVWLTPPGARGPDDKGLEPFYAGTYFPREPRHGMPAFTDLLRSISAAWDQQRAEVIEQAARVTDALRQQLAEPDQPAPVGGPQVGAAVSSLLRLFDSEHGGFGEAPKFPQPVFLDLLMEATPALEDPAVASSCARAVRFTLDRMAMGGLFDQVGGGFHRYSTDERWLVPHFEKMLYDNAQLASTYACSLAASSDPFDERVLRRVIEYVQRELTAPGGAFFSAQDAEVNQREGQNYLWTRAQLDAALSPDDAAFAARVYGVDEGPNFQDPHHPHEPPSGVLFLSDRPERLARAIGLDPGAFDQRLRSINQQLLEARARRDQPGLDDKVLVAWNGMMIQGLADAARALRDEALLLQAREASAWILRELGTPDGGLRRGWRAGAAGATPAFLEDYAQLAAGLLATHRAGVALGRPDPADLSHAVRLLVAARERFEDPQRPGLFHDTLDAQPDLIVRTRSLHDGALPSGSSVMLHNFIDVYELTGQRRWLDEAAAALTWLSASIARSPLAAVNATRGLFRMLRLDEALVRSVLGSPSGASSPSPGPEQPAPAEVFASEDRVLVPRAGHADLQLELRIAPGFHINASDPGVSGLTPLDVRLEGGTGIRAEVTYPRGERLQSGGPDGPFVHSVAVPMTVRLSRDGAPLTGRPLLMITYQPCTDRECLSPVRVELDVAIDAE